MVRIFIDTNVWFSAFYGSENCRKIIEAHRQRKIIAAVSQKVIEESLINIQLKAPHILSKFKKFILNNPPEIIVDPQVIDTKIKKLVEFKDRPIFISAMLAKVDYFVTGNIKDFKVRELEKATGIKVFTPSAIVKVLKL